MAWFWEGLPANAWRSAVRLERQCDLLISVGTSGGTLPAADIPNIALAACGTVIHVNLEDVGVRGVNETILVGSAGGVFSALLQAV
ncbi:hypothetical protein L1A22_23170 [Pseudomonas extremaustralis]|nr:hypothetical protein L1A22_23170 [Pseudomonas extremaustralis]